MPQGKCAAQGAHYRHSPRTHPTDHITAQTLGESDDFNVKSLKCRNLEHHHLSLPRTPHTSLATIGILVSRFLLFSLYIIATQLVGSHNTMKRIVGSSPEGTQDESSNPTPEQQQPQQPRIPDARHAPGGRLLLPPELMSIITPSLQVGAGFGRCLPSLPPAPGTRN